MASVKLFFKLVETGNYVSGGSDGYFAEKNQAIEDLKINAASYYDLEEVTTAWLLRHENDSGLILGNSQTVAGCGLKDNDVLFIQDPELVKISCSDDLETKIVWAYRSDTMKSVKTAAFGQTTGSSLVLGGTKLDENSLVHSLVDKISLRYEPSPSTPQTILPGLKEGRYRLKNSFGRWLSVPSDILDVFFHPTTGTYFDVRLVSSGIIQISYLDNMDVRRYLYRTDNANEYAISLSSAPQNPDFSRWTVSSVNNDTTFRLSSATPNGYYLLFLNNYPVKPKMLGLQGYADWSFVE